MSHYIGLIALSVSWPCTLKEIISKLFQGKSCLFYRIIWKLIDNQKKKRKTINKEDAQE